MWFFIVNKFLIEYSFVTLWDDDDDFMTWTRAAVEKYEVATCVAWSRFVDSKRQQ